MRKFARLGLCLIVPALAPAAALAGGHAPASAVVARPSAGIHAAAGPRAIRLAPKPTYGAPQHAIYGPPRNYVRHGRRYRGAETGFVGLPFAYLPPVDGAAAQAQPGDRLRPRPVVVTNYNGAPPLWQGDAGYVAQPVIYNVRTVLRRYPLTDAPHIGK